MNVPSLPPVKEDSRPPFIWTPRQKIDADQTFLSMIRDGPKRREDGTNRWLLFRRTFALTAKPSRAMIDITVDGRYQLFVNGTRIGRGPVRSNPHFQRYDSYDIAKYLVKGTNVLAVLVHVYGLDTSWYETVKGYWQPYFGDGGLYCDTRIEGPDASYTRISSDTLWRCQVCNAWRADTPRAGWGQGFIEDFDASKMPDGWTTAHFNDESWDKVQLLTVPPDQNSLARGWSEIVPFPQLALNDMPPLAEKPVAPVKINAVYGVLPSPDLPLDRRLYDEELVDIPSGLVEAPHALLKNDAATTLVHTNDEHDVSIFIAFEKLHSAYPFIEIEAKGGEIIELAVSETFGGEFDNPQPAIPRLKLEGHLDCAHLFRYTARPGIQRFEKFEWTAVRYMQITIRNAREGLKIRHAGSIHTHYPLEYAGAYNCSDDFLNRFWQIGRYTAQECTHDAWEDCPGREKRQWIGDGIVHYVVSAAAFGPSSQPVDRKFLYDAAHSQRPDGLMQMFAPGDHHTNGVIIPDFNLHWIGALYHYFLHTGDTKTVEDLIPTAQRSLGWFERLLDQHDLITNVPFWHFIEWAHVGRHGQSSIINAMFVGALKSVADIARWLEMPRLEQKYSHLATRISDALNKRHWDDVRNVYVDVVNPVTGQQEARVSQHANAAMIYWDIAPRARWAAMIDRITDPQRCKLTSVPPIVMRGEDFDPETDVVEANTYFSHFVYGALAKARRFDLVLAAVRKNYGPMLATDTETLWEAYEPSASLCHAFSASPVYQLSAHSLGIQPLLPGFDRFLIAPQPADLTHASGVYATIKGDIKVAWKQNKDVFEINLTIPEGCQATFVAPPGFDQDSSETILGPGEHKLTVKPSVFHI